MVQHSANTLNDLSSGVIPNNVENLKHSDLELSRVLNIDSPSHIETTERLNILNNFNNPNEIKPNSPEGTNKKKEEEQSLFELQQIININKDTCAASLPVPIIGRSMSQNDLNSVSPERGGLAEYQPAADDDNYSVNNLRGRPGLFTGVRSRGYRQLVSDTSTTPRLIPLSGSGELDTADHTPSYLSGCSQSVKTRLSDNIDSLPLLSTIPLDYSEPWSCGPFFQKVSFTIRVFLWNLKYLFLPYKAPTQERVISLSGKTSPSFFAPNVLRNHRYNILTLVPMVLFSQFKSVELMCPIIMFIVDLFWVFDYRFFFNLFYLGVALAQFLPQLQVGPLFTYVAPLSFVLFVTLIKETYDDYQRYCRDREANSTIYDVLDARTGRLQKTEAQQLRVGNILKLHANQRVPCDAIVLRAPKPGTTFLRTDQLDGETDWKLRRAVIATQSLNNDVDMLRIDAWVVVEPPRRNIYEFMGTFCTTSFFPNRLPSEDQTHLTDVGYSNTRTNSSLTSPLSTVENRKNTALQSSNKHHPVDMVIDINSETKGKHSPQPGTELFNDINLTVSSRQITIRSSLNKSVVSEPLALENVLWGSTVITSGPVWVLIIYTGSDSRAVLNTSAKRTKIGIFDSEVNTLSKALFCILVLMAILLVICKGLSGIWMIYFARFILLLSSIIPISLRVNLDLAKAYYSWLISNDTKLDSTVVRNSSMPEELGRIDVLLTDKTGTLTQNDMVFKKLHIGRAVFTDDSVEDIREYLMLSLTPPSSIVTVSSSNEQSSSSSMINSTFSTSSMSRRRLDVWDKLRRTMLGLAVCHNVTPILDELTQKISFQASSPDEMALVSFAASAGFNLVSRTDTELTLIGPNNISLEFDILFVFPFTSETKRMGCIVRHRPGLNQFSCPLTVEAGRILFFLKGAESVMLERLESRGAHWLQEECDNFARVGLRTLVIAVKELSEQELDIFSLKYAAAQSCLRHRSEKVRDVISSLETEMSLLGLTGVEDRLQQDVPQTLESFRHAGIHVWMVTGDKIETATCVAVSAGLKARQHMMFKLSASDFSTPQEAQEALETFALGPTETVLIVDGPFIDIAIHHFPHEFITAACQAPAAICCRCSPTQKADIARLIQKVTGKRIAAVGDGGNDVSMIQAANCGIGIVGKEGKQASLAADFSITHFRNLHRLLFWHGRNCYQRSAKLAHFVMHRGLIIATIQVIFSAIFFFIPMAIFQGWLTVGYATYYTMLPVFSLVLDIELSESVVFMFPELYDSLRRGRAMSPKTFFLWLWTSVYQGAVIMLGAILLFESEFVNIVSITFTSLILSELLNVASEVRHWHSLMVIAEIITIFIYIISMVLLPNYFNLSFISTPLFWWKVGIITVVSWMPLHCLKMILLCWQPTRDSKLTF